MAKVKKTLISTFFNESASIVKLIDSILAQTELPDEIILVDGGSADNTLELARTRIQKSAYRRKFKLFLKKGNRSIGRNEAIKRSSSEIIAICDAGCILDRNWFKLITKPLEDKKVDVVAGYYKALAKTEFEKNVVPYVFVMPDKVNKTSFLPATRSMAIRKNVWKNAGGFDPRLSNNEDYAFAKKLQKMKLRIVFAGQAIVYWIPRRDIFQFFNMLYRFAKGDAEAKILRPKVVLIFARYLIAMLLLFTFNFSLLTLLGVIYLIWSIVKNFRYVNSYSAFIYLPLLQMISDLAVITGTVKGLSEG